VKNTHHWSERTETATENKTGQAGSRRHCSSHQISDACFVHTFLQYSAHAVITGTPGKKLRQCRDSTRRLPLRHSRSFKVIDLLLAINTNIHPISHRFQVITDFRQILTGAPVLQHSFGRPHKFKTAQLGFNKLETSLYRKVFIHWRVIISFCYDLRVQQTDKRTETYWHSKTVQLKLSKIQFPSIHNICSGTYVK